MKRKHLIKLVSLLVLTALSLSMSGCTHKDKEVVLTSNVKSASNQEANQVEKNIQLGNKYLDNGKYNEAKTAYNKAISLDKMNKNTYLAIKDKYLSKGNIEEAKNILQEAIDYGVDTSNIKVLLLQINSKIEASKELNKKLQRKPYKQENQIKIQSQNQPQIVSTKPDTVPSENKKIIAFVGNIYDRQGKRYVSVDEVEFYRGDEATKEAAKDGDKSFAINDYYIRNPDRSVKEYEISNNAKFNMGKWVIDKSFDGNGTINEEVSYDTIKNSLSMGGLNLYWITIENNVVTQMDEQYIP